MSNSRLNAYFATVHSTLRSQKTREQRYLSARVWPAGEAGARAPASCSSTAPARAQSAGILWHGHAETPCSWEVAITSMEVFIRPLHTRGTPERQQTDSTHDPEGTVGLWGRGRLGARQADPRWQPSDRAGAIAPELCLISKTNPTHPCSCEPTIS